MRLYAKSTVAFGAENGVPTNLKTPKGVYFILLISMLLWGSAFGSLLADWPTDSEGNTLDKRYEGFDNGIQFAIENGPLWGLLAMDGVMM